MSDPLSFHLVIAEGCNSMTTSLGPVKRSPRYQRLLTDLRGGQKTVLLDGPISTELDSRGVTMASGKERRVAKDDPESLVQVHMDYINAGAQIITTNTFGRTREVLGPDFEELTRAAVGCALEARGRTGTEDSVIVAGSLAYHSARGPGNYDPTQKPDSWANDMNDLVRLLKSAGVDVLLLEMVGGPTFTAPIIRAAQASRIPFWVGFSAYEETEGNALRVFDNAATPINEALPGLIRLATEGPEGIFKGGGDSGADVIGAMHCKPAVLGAVLEAVQFHGWDGTMLAYPDDVQEWNPATKSGVYSKDAVDVYSTHCVTWRRDFPKCTLLGACCGFSVKHIADLYQRLRMEAPVGKF